MLETFFCGVLDSRMSTNEQFKQIDQSHKLRDVNQVRTILDEDGKLVHAYDETGRNRSSLRDV
jgi:hypothetical protein